MDACNLAIVDAFVTGNEAYLEKTRIQTPI